MSLNYTSVYNFDDYKGKENETLEVECTGQGYTSINTQLLINKFPNLESIIIDSTLLLKIPEELKMIKKLKRIKLLGNLVTSNFSGIQNLVNLTELTISWHLSLNYFSIRNLVNLKVLSLSLNNISILPSEIENLINLETLDLSKNFIQILPPEIGKLKKLKILQLHHNFLESLPPEIKNLKNLEILSLGVNHLKSFPNEIFDLTNLRSLELCVNNIMSLPSDIQKLTRLEVLELSETEISHLPKELGKLTSLKSLILSANEIEKLPIEVFNLANLIELWLDKNQLTSLPDEIGNLVNLRILRIDHNILSLLPRQFGDLINLEILIAFDNKLTSLPNEFGNLLSLEILDLRKNEIERILKQIGKLINLKEFRADANNICDIPIEIGNLVNLEVLGLSENVIQSLPVEIGNLLKLVELDLCYNEIEFLPEQIGNLKSLKNASVRSNKLTYLPKEIGNLSNLEFLESDQNLLKSLPIEIGSLKKLKVIDLSYNLLTYLPYSICFLEQSLQILKLIGNPIEFVGQPDKFGEATMSLIFQDRVQFSGVENVKKFKPISTKNVYLKIKDQNIHWNVDKLKTIESSQIPMHSLSGLEILRILRENLCPLLRNSENSSIFYKYVEHLYFPNIDYKLWRMIPAYVNSAQDLIEAIIRRLIENISEIEKINSNVNAICEGIEFCPDRQMAELRFCYYMLEGENDPNNTLKSFVYSFIATQKEKVFDYTILPSNSNQNTHVLNYWKYTLSDELGFGFKFRSLYDNKEQDQFHGRKGNALDAFYKVFTPSLIIKLLTDTINENKPIMCLALMHIFESQLTLHVKNNMFESEDQEHTTFNGSKITKKFVEAYLIEIGVLEYKTKV